MRNSRYTRHSRPWKESVGVLGSVVTFGVGYVVGAKTGARRVPELPGRVARLARRVRPRRNEPSARTIDVREVREVMSAAPDAVRPTDTVQRRARLMSTSDIGCVIVETKKGRLSASSPIGTSLSELRPRALTPDVFRQLS